MKFPNQSEEIFSVLEDAIEKSGFTCDQRRIFGHKTYFVNGYMFAGVFGEAGIHLRVGQTIRDNAVENITGTAYFEANGRVLKDHLLLREQIFADREILSDWLQKAYSHTSSLAPKKKK